MGRQYGIFEMRDDEASYLDLAPDKQQAVQTLVDFVLEWVSTTYGHEDPEAIGDWHVNFTGGPVELAKDVEDMLRTDVIYINKRDRVSFMIPDDGFAIYIMPVR